MEDKITKKIKTKSLELVNPIILLELPVKEDLKRVITLQAIVLQVSM